MKHALSAGVAAIVVLVIVLAVRSGGEDELAPPPAPSPSRPAPTAEPVASHEPPPVEFSTTFRARELDEDPIPGCTLFLRRTEQAAWETLGQTGEHGRFILRGIDPSSLLEGTVGARHSRFAPIAVPVRDALDDADRVIDLMLDRPAGSICGRVTRDGAGAAELGGIHVIAWPQHSEPRSADLVAAFLTGSPLDMHTLTGATGEFALDGLDRSLPWTVTAGGHGYAASTPCRGVFAGDDVWIEIALGCVHLAWVRVVDLEGAAPRTSPYIARVSVSPPRRPGTKEIVSNFLMPQDVHLGLAALGTGFPTEWPREAEHLWVLQDEGCEPWSDATGFSCSLPGYQGATASVPWQRLSPASEPTVVRVEQTAPLGGLVIEVSGVPDTGDFDGPLGELHLLPDGDGQRALTMHVRFPLREPLIIDGVPAGEYAALFTPIDRHSQWPHGEWDGRHVIIRPDSYSDIRVDLSPTGGLRWSILQRASRAPYPGEVSLNVHRKGMTGNSHHEWKGVTWGLRDGEYTVRAAVRETRWDAWQPLPPQECRIEAGRFVDLEWIVDP